jgi:hypothetical protein
MTLMFFAAPSAAAFMFPVAFIFYISSFFSVFLSSSPPQLSTPPRLADIEAVPLTAPVAAGERVVLRVKVVPRDGISIYAPDEKTGKTGNIYRSIALKLDRAPGVSAEPPVYPAAEWGTFDGERARVYRRPFDVDQPVRVTGPAGRSVRVTGTLEYQACDDVMCYRPLKVSLGWDVPLR